MAEVFVDTSVLLYVLTPDVEKATIAEEIIAARGDISAQVMNEFLAVALRKFKAPAASIDQALAICEAAFAVHPVTLQTHQLGQRICERYRLGVYDSMIVASALIAGCDLLYTEDLQSGQVIEGVLTVRNPFKA